MKRITLQDGSQWPDPRESELEWKLRHNKESLTKSDLLCVAEVVHAYNRLINEHWDAHKKLTMIRAKANGGAASLTKKTSNRRQR